jgi:hypothetical protein
MDLQSIHLEVYFTENLIDNRYLNDLIIWINILQKFVCHYKIFFLIK